MNALIPGVKRATGYVNAVTGKGRHTSSSAFAHKLKGGGWLIDTPGIRTFGLAHVSVEDILHAFPDLDEAAQMCLKGCQHKSSQGCALDGWAGCDPQRLLRLQSLRRLLSTSLTTYDKLS